MCSGYGYASGGINSIAPTNRQELLGHSDVSTNMIYTYVLNRGGKGVCVGAGRRGPSHGDATAQTHVETAVITDARRLRRDRIYRLRLRALLRPVQSSPLDAH